MSIAHCSQKPSILRIALALGAIKTMSSAYAKAPVYQLPDAQVSQTTQQYRANNATLHWSPLITLNTEEWTPFQSTHVTWLTYMLYNIRNITAGICRFILHWLRLPERVKFKACVLMHRCLTGAAPRYLTELAVPVASTARRRQRSVSSADLVVPNSPFNHRWPCVRCCRSTSLEQPTIWHSNRCSNVRW